MSRIRLRNGGKCRRKALLGADGALMAAATLAAAGMNTAATLKGASEQSKAVISNAKSQADAIKLQSENDTQLQKENIQFQKEQNNEIKEQQQQIQTTLQMMAGQENANDISERNKVALKLGGKGKHRRRLATSFYGGALPFKVTDGGGVIPINTDGNGYGLYEIVGNDHEHYHKAPGGKMKSGVGIKFDDGSVVEGEGNQGTSRGEKLLVTPNDAMFISKHSIKGFNPSDAVDAGMNPQQAFIIQESIKSKYGIKDDGSNMNKKRLGGNARRRRTLAEDGKLKTFLKDNAGAVYGAAGNLAGAGLQFAGNLIASNKLANSYAAAGRILSDAYGQMKTIDPSIISKEDFAPTHAMAAVRTANTNVNPLVERIRRNSQTERRMVNAGTTSDAVRQQRLAGINDRSYQRMSEIEANKRNMDDRIKSENARLITQVSGQNAQLDAQANQQYTAQKLTLAQYNNNIENAKIAGAAQANANATLQGTQVKSQALATGLGAIGAGLTASAQGFANSWSQKTMAERDFDKVLTGLDGDKKVQALITNPNSHNRATAENLWKTWSNSDNEILKSQAKQLDDVFGFSKSKSIGNKSLAVAGTSGDKNNYIYNSIRYLYGR